MEDAERFKNVGELPTRVFFNLPCTHTHTHTTQMGKDKTFPQLVFTNVRVNFKLSDGLRGSWWFFGFVIFYLGVFSPHN